MERLFGGSGRRPSPSLSCLGNRNILRALWSPCFRGFFPFFNYSYFFKEKDKFFKKSINIYYDSKKLFVFEISKKIKVKLHENLFL